MCALTKKLTPVIPTKSERRRSDDARRNPEDVCPLRCHFRKFSRECPRSLSVKTMAYTQCHCDGFWFYLPSTKYYVLSTDAGAFYASTCFHCGHHRVIFDVS